MKGRKKFSKSRLALSFLLALTALSGCMAKIKEPPVPAPEQTGAKSYTIGVSMPTTRLVYRKTMKELVEAAYPETEAHPDVRVQIYDAGGSQKQQNQDILKMVDSGVDGIVLVPNTMEGCLSSVEYANKKGVPVITVDNRIRDTASAQVVSFIGSDHSAMGRDAAELFLTILEKRYPEKEQWNVIHLTGIPDSSGTIDRGQAIAEILAKNERICLLGTFDGEFTVKNAKSVMEDCLAIYGEIDGVICQNDNMAEGCYQALEEAGRDGDVIVVGIDGQKSTLEIMKKGGIHGTVLQHPSMILKGIEALCGYLDGKPLEKNYFEPTDVIDADSVDYYLQHDLSW